VTVEVGTAVVTLIPSAKGFSAAIRKELGGDIGAAGGAAGDQAGGSFVKGFTSHLGTIAKLGAASIAALGVAAAGYGLKVASENEQAQISFETMLGSAEAANAFLADMKKFAATTPFEFPELQKAASSLISVGVDASKVLPIMKNLGDVTSGMGTGAEGVQRATVALQQMSAAGRITGEDLNQLRDAGVPVFDLLAAATGKSKEELAGMAQSGKLGKQELDQLMAALESGKGLERFSGLMDKQSQSLTGMVSTLKDTLGQGLADAVAPAMPAIKDALGGLSGALGESMKTVGPMLGSVVGSIAQALSTLIPVIAPILDMLGGVFATVIQALIPIVQEMTPYLAEFAHVIGFELNEALAVILPAFGELIKALLPLLPLIAELAGVFLQQFAKILVQLAIALVPVIQALVAHLVPVMEQMLPILPELVDAFMPLIPPLAELLLALTPLIAELLTLQTKALAALLPYLIPIILAVTEFAATVMHDAVPAVKSIVDFLLHLGDRLGQLDFSAIIAKVGEFAGMIGTKLLEWGGKVLAALPGVLAAIGNWILTTGVPTLVTAVAGLAGALVGWIGQGIAWLVPKLGEWLAAFGVWVAETAIPWVLSKMAELAVGLLLWIVKAAIELPVHLAEFLAKIGIWVVTEAIPWLIDKGTELQGAFLSFIVDAITALPGKLVEFGAMLIGFIAGLPAQIDAAAKGMFNGLANAFIAAINWVIRTWNDFKLAIPEVEILGKKIGGFTLDTIDISEIKTLAGGGALRAGELSLVGERGPEFWQPRTAGTIIPANRLAAPAAGAGGGMHIENLQVTGQEKPQDTAFVLTRELRRVAFFGGANYQATATPA
jgi:tape measure domain-containing protein